MEKGSSPLDTIRQLKELLDAGTITPQEFDTLKARLLAEPPTAPAAPLNPPVPTPDASSSGAELARPDVEKAGPLAPDTAAARPTEELPPLLDFFKQPPTPVAPPTPTPAPAAAPPYTPPVSPAPAPEFFPPRPTPPSPPTPKPAAPPEFFPPAVSEPSVASAPRTTPDFFSPPAATPPRPPVPPVAAATPLGAAAENEEEEEIEEPVRKSSLGKILAIGGGLLLVGLIWYLLMGQSRSSEHLTSTSQTAADTVSAPLETGPQAEQLELEPAAAPETVRVAPVVPPTVPTDSGAIAGSNTVESQTTQAATAPPTPETAPAENANEATGRVRDVLAAYYADIQAAPFSADQYFAPQVELFVILRNTTPTAISAWLDQNRFPEFKDAQIQVEPGSLRVSPPAADGSRVVNYVERGRAFRQSLQKNQYIRAQMRLRLNPDYKITYQKQERLLENTLSDAVAPPPTPE